MKAAASRRVRRSLGVALAVLASAGLGWASRAPLPGDALGDGGAIRLSWRMRDQGDGGGCVPPTPEELERLPVHMRNPDACMGRGLAFLLEVDLDGAPLIADTLEPAGARGDRPVFVLRELPVTAGEHHLVVRFAALGAGASDAHVLDERVRVRPRTVLLVTYDPEADRLVTIERQTP